MSLQKELAELRKKNFKPIYTLFGTERHLINMFKNTLKQEISVDGEDEFNFITFDMGEVEVSQVIHEAETVPFFGDYKVIFVENPYFLTGERRKNDLEHDVSSLNSYLENPLETTILVFIASYEKMDERKKIVKLLKKESCLVDVKQMSEKELTPYLKQYIENEGYQIDKLAFEQLTYLTDMDLSRMMNELDKLFLYRLDTKIIKRTDVEALIPKSLEHNIFDLSQYVLSNQMMQSLSLYHDLIHDGEETIKVIAVLLGQVRLLLQVKLLLDMNYQQSNITDTLKIHPYRVKLAVNQSKNLTLGTLGEMFNELIDIDYQIKTGQMDKELIFEMFLLKKR
ncbi:MULTISPECIES: DNA polymerase III subunit delta [Vagococcus]|uniref:DNA polymerase III subunit delta n=1 Tax=Vagococcus fluvialis bH819 TaxID=1255619 RepID=A0A1X6WR19_9ENTE|nr:MULTISPECIES: DNA polymerase III subunit delta [Vagococcus]SLM86698.1 DNA polymerase III delta subunit [Vagococcus fluvialis bH819]HCM90906.1 DNA polymerase III subunit delta [Vagococcus sp.]